MGGLGSGRRWHFGAKDTTVDYRKLDVRRWAREGYLTPGRAFGWRWSLDGETVASIRVQAEDQAVRLKYRTRANGEDWRDMNYRVWLDRTPCHYGGERVWFLCPARGCGRRVALLYGGAVFACRHCYDLAYPVQREDASDRAARRAEKLRERLGWECGLFDLDGDKPKGMHWRTFHRLATQAERAEQESLGLMMARLSGDAASVELLKSLARLA